MCGIFGITEENRKLIKNFINKCSHRGPDATDIFSTNYLTLGHNLLAITSKPTEGKQPWVSERGNVIIYNGELIRNGDPEIIIKDELVKKIYLGTNYQ